MDVRTKFLSSAAHLYITTAPETAAHLMRCRNENATLDDETSPPAKGACRSCGSVSIPGWNSKATIVNTEPPNRKRKRGRAPAKVPGNLSQDAVMLAPSVKVLHTECLVCGCYWNSPLLEKSRSAKVRKLTSLSEAPPIQGTKALQAKKVRSRKKGGLQALLAESKLEANPSPTFSLMEFMKSA